MASTLNNLEESIQVGMDKEMTRQIKLLGMEDLIIKEWITELLIVNDSLFTQNNNLRKRLGNTCFNPIED